MSRPTNTKIICPKTREDLGTDWMWGLMEESERGLMFQACKGPYPEEGAQKKKLLSRPPPDRYREVPDLSRRGRTLRSLGKILVHRVERRNTWMEGGW